MVRTITAADDAAALRMMAAAPEFPVASRRDRNAALLSSEDMIAGWDETIAQARAAVETGDRAELVSLGKLAANLLAGDYDRNFYALLVEYLRAAVETMGAAPAAPAAPVADRPAVANIAHVHDGYYTAVLTSGGHVTLRIRNAKWAEKPDFRKIGILTGPVNFADYQYCAFAFGDGNVKLKDQYRQDGRIAEALQIIAGDPAAAGKGYAVASGNCYVCGKLLTDEGSIAAGIGPICAAKLAGL